MIDQDSALMPEPGKYAVIEINSNPGISIHHHPGCGREHDVAGAIVDLLFPETKKG